MSGKDEEVGTKQQVFNWTLVEKLKEYCEENY